MYSVEIGSKLNGCSFYRFCDFRPETDRCSGLLDMVSMCTIHLIYKHVTQLLLNFTLVCYLQYRLYITNKYSVLHLQLY
ncbi:hypothetical protein QL285_091214 [Trifolium repens]|nr:hypothetical protein QL285_091214 [Trifolium repens]